MVWLMPYDPGYLLPGLMPSIWEKQSFLAASDFTIVGSGITGLSTALSIREKYPSASIQILEKGIHPAGASLKNAGFACFGSPSEILDDASKDGLDQAIDRVIRRYEGLIRLRERIGNDSLIWSENGGYEVFGASEHSALSASIEMLPTLNHRLISELGIQPYSISSESFGMNCLQSLIKISGEASIHSGEVIKRLAELCAAQKINLMNGAEVTGYNQDNDGVSIRINERDDIRTERLVLCTNAYTRDLVDLDVWPNRGQVLLTEPIPGLQLKGNYHLHEGYFYFRDFMGGILLGGGRHLDKTGEQTNSHETTEMIQNALEELLQEVIIPNTAYSIKHRWAGTMGFGAMSEKEPIIKEIEPGVFAAVRLGGMGVAMASMVGEQIAELI